LVVRAQHSGPSARARHGRAGQGKGNALKSPGCRGVRLQAGAQQRRHFPRPRLVG
jgi:hypothetical protein